MNDFKNRPSSAPDDIFEIQEKLSHELDRAQKEHQDKMEAMNDETSGKIDRITNEIRKQTTKVIDETEIIFDQSM